jgi:hypothetical protein
MEIVTQVELSTAQIRYLIDVMWGLPANESQALAIRHGISDVELERALTTYLSLAYSEA